MLSTQTQLLATSGHEPPSAVQPGHYVPVLQNKPGELNALRHLHEETWRHIRPILLFVGPKGRKQPLQAPTITNWVKRVEAAVGTRPFYVDLLRLDPAFPVATASHDVPVLERIYTIARKRGLRPIPVAHVGEQATTRLNLVANAVIEDRQGVALRYALRRLLPPPGTTRTQILTDLLASIGCDVTEADLLIDLEYLDPDYEIEAEDLVAPLEQMVEVGDWRSVVLLGSSMPSMLGSIPEGSSGSIERREWAVWERLTELAPPRIPAFGDYAIQHPQPPAGGGPGMRANIRYSTNGATFIVRGRGPFIQEGTGQYTGLCEMLVARTDFAGSDFSWGDQTIADCAAGRLAPGTQGMWRGAGTSHHIRFVTEQLAPYR